MNDSQPETTAPEEIEESIARYRAAVQACLIAGQLLTLHDLPRILAEMDRADSLGPILDPTLWSRKHKAMAEDRKVVAAALPLRKLVLALFELKLGEGESAEVPQ